jgi:hypothetical protein
MFGLTPFYPTLQTMPLADLFGKVGLHLGKRLSPA